MEGETGRFVPQDPVPLRPVRVVIPAEVAFDLGNLHRTIDNLAQRLGCEACFSGRSCVFELERDFIVNPQNLEVKGLSERRF
jgi:hypothetical protein